MSAFTTEAVHRGAAVTDGHWSTEHDSSLTSMRDKDSLEGLGEPDKAEVLRISLHGLDCLLLGCRVDEGRKGSEKMLAFRPSSELWVVRSSTDLKKHGREVVG